MGHRRLIGNSMASRRVLFVIDIASGRESDVLPIDGDGDRRSEGNLTLFF